MSTSDRPNTPIPDELAAVREEIKRLEEREGELRRLLITNPDLRAGAKWIAEIKVTQRETTDLKELRACHPDIAAEFTHTLEHTRVVLSGLTEDGELLTTRQMRQRPQT